MSAALVSDKELTVTLKIPIIEHHVMIIIIPMKCQIELVEAEAIAFLGIPFGFLNLSDHS